MPRASVPHAPAPPGGASRALDLLYLAAGGLLLPYFLYRRLVKRKQSAPWRAKLGHVPARAPGVRRVWIHAVSVGEAAAAEVLVKELRRRDPALDAAVSTTTVTGQEVARKRYGAENVFFYPLDLSCAVRRALDRIQPELIVLMELEVWPNLTAEAAARGIPVVVANARITARSARRYRRFWRLAGPAFLRVDRWLAQTEEYARRLKDMGVPAERIQVAGNIKYDAVDTALPPPEERARIRAELGIADDAPVVIGGSTHPTEEAALLAACAALRAKGFPNLRLILAPRHPERIAAVLAEAEAAGFQPARRSEMAAASAMSIASQPRSDSARPVAVVVDTMGELKSLYKAADVAFIGGSLIPHGGQNVMEPCGLGIPVVHGPYMFNFNDAMELLRACDGSVQTSGNTGARESRGSLESALAKLLRDRAAAGAMAARARAAFLAAQGATTRTADVLQELWPRKRQG